MESRPGSGIPRLPASQSRAGLSASPRVQGGPGAYLRFMLRISSLSSRLTRRDSMIFCNALL